MIVAGLGNPGTKYERTRHNVGFLVVDELLRRSGAVLDKKRFNSLVGKAVVGGREVFLVKPQTFMNLSGQAVGPMMGFHHLSRGEVIVVHDELDLHFGTVRVKVGGGHGGHNGLRDLLTSLGGGDFVRIRVGVGRPLPGQEGVDHVLTSFRPEEAAALPEVLNRAADAVEAVISSGVITAMNRTNGVSASRRTLSSEAAERTPSGEAPGKAN